MRTLPASLLAICLASSLAAQGSRSVDPLAAYLGHGVSHPLATWRSGTIKDVRYDLSLDVTAPDSAIGHVTVRFNRSGKSDAILDWRGRRLTRIMSNGQPVPLSAANGAHILLPAKSLESGENSVELWFVSDIAPSGASIIRTHS